MSSSSSPSLLPLLLMPPHPPHSAFIPTAIGNASLDEDYADSGGRFGDVNKTDASWNGTLGLGGPSLSGTSTGGGNRGIEGAEGGVGQRGGGGGGGSVVEAAARELQWVFVMHALGFACVYFAIAFYAFFSILNLRSLISSRPYMSTINGFLCLLGSSRAACLFIDPYNLRESMPKAIRSLLWDVGFPCLTSAFCLIQLAFLQLTQSGQLVPQHRLCQLSPSTTVYIVSPWTRAKKYVLNLGPEKLRRKSCLSLVITAHFTCLITTDVAATFHDELAVGKLVVQVVFLLWGFFLSATFLYGGYKVMQLLRHGVPRRAGSSGASSTGGGCGGRLLPSEGCSRGPLSPPPLDAHEGHMPPTLLLTAEEARLREAESQHKGIMQLALVAPLGVGVGGGGGGLASSLALLPRALLSSTGPPKIRITDEHERTFSLASSAGPASAAATPATPATPLPPSRPHSTTPYSVDNGHEGDGEEEDDGSSSSSESGADASSVRHSRKSLRCSGVRRQRQIGGVQARRRPKEGESPSSAALVGRSGNFSAPEHSRVSSPMPPPSTPHRKKSLTWRETSTNDGREQQCSGGGGSCSGKTKGGAVGEDECAREEESSLLPHSINAHQRGAAGEGTMGAEADFNLHAILGHITRSSREEANDPGGKKNKGKRGSEGVAGYAEWGGGCTGAVGRSRGQVSQVLKVTYVAALCCAAICLFDGGRLYAAYTAEVAERGVGRGHLDEVKGEGPPSERPSPWPWFCLQTLSRALEIAMAIAMANVTKTPVHRYHHHNFEPEGHLNQQHHHHSGYSFRLKQMEAPYM